MPLLKIQTNVPVDDATANELLARGSATVAEQLGKPERYVMVSVEHNPHMLFAGSAEPLAYLELKSIGLPGDRTADLSRALADLLGDSLDLAPDRVYIEFADAARHMWGWNGGTF